MATNPNEATAEPKEQLTPTFGGIIPPAFDEAASAPDPAGLISLEETAPDTSISIIPAGEVRPGVTGKPAEQRASKAHFGLGDASPGMDSILASIQNGTEDMLRQRVAQAEELKVRDTKLQIIREKAAQGGEILPEDVAFMGGMAAFEPKVNPETVLEKQYSRALVSSTNHLGGGPNSPIGQAYRANPEKLANQMSVAEELITRQEIVKNAIEDIEAVYNKQGWGSWAVDQAKSLVPLYESFKLGWNNDKSDSMLKGNVVQDMVNRYWSMPVDEMATALRTDLQDLAKDNPTLAREVAHAVLSHTSSDQWLSNAFTVFDAATLPGVGTAVKMSAKGAGKAAEAVAGKAATTVAANSNEPASKALKDLVEANATPTTDVAKMLTQAGDIDKAVEVVALSKAEAIFNKADHLGQSRPLREEVPSIFSPEKVANGEKPNLSLAAVNSVVSSLERNAEAIAQVVAEGVKVGRLPEEALAAAIRVEAKKVQDDLLRNGLPEDAILDVSWVRPDEVMTNAGQVTVHFGDKSGRLFNRLIDGEHYARTTLGLPAGSFNVRQYGVGWAAEVTRTLDETDSLVRAKILTGNNETPVSLSNMLFGMLRSADDRVSPFQRENRLAVVHGRSALEHAMSKAVDDIGFMAKGDTDELNTVMKLNKYEVDPATGARGRFYDTISDFETSFFKTVGKHPTEQQTKAYFTYRQLNDWDWVLRNMGVYRDRARIGVQSVLLKDTGEVDGKVLSFLDEFNGKIVEDLPWGNAEDASVLIHKSGSAPTRLRTKTANADPAQKLEIQRLIKEEGYKIVQVENPTRVPFEKRFGKETVNFIVTKDFEVKPLSWKQIPYRPGWHTEYPQEFFVKQPKVRTIGDEGVPKRNIYEGDTSVFGFRSQAEADKYAGLMETARKMLLAGDEKLGDFLTKNLPFTESQFKGFFVARIGDSGEEIPAMLDKAAPFLRTFTGKTTTDEHGDLLRNQFEGFEDTVRSSYNLFANVDKKFIGQRDNPLWTVDEIGSELNPALKITNAPEIDPILSVQKAMSNIIRSRQFSDYKIAHVEAWTQQFGHLLDVDKDSLLSNPVFHIHNPTWKQTDASNRAIMRAAADSRRALLELLGTKGDLAITVDAIKAKLLDSIYTSRGQKASNRVAESGVGRDEKDPVSLMRKTAFHTNIGLFNPYQLVQNAATMANVIGIAGPKNGFMGAAAALPMRYALHNELMLDKMSRVMTSFGWKPEQFKEAFQELKRTGKWIVEGEHTWADDISEPSVVKTKVGSVLDGGLVFFREGERTTRLTAWAAAYKEWRGANPSAVIDDTVRRQLMYRSDLFAANMTRASNATWQQGLMAVPAQFLSYHTRLAEQMLGTRLTAAEKARVIGVNSLLYGVPIGALGASGAGAIFGGQYAPHEAIREEFLKRGFNMDSTAMEAFHGGLVNVLSKVVVGESTDLASKLGPGGGSLWKNLLFEDKTFLDIIFGASGSKTGSVYDSLDPVVKFLVSPFRGDDKQFPLRPEDALGVLRNIKSVDNAVNVYYAMNAGKMFAKNGQYLGETDVMQQMFQTLTGGQPRKLTDTMLMQGMNIDRAKVLRDVMSKVSNDVNSLVDAAAKGDSATVEMYRTRIATIMNLADLRLDERGNVFREATKKHRSKIDQVNWDFVWKLAPGKNVEDRQNNYLNKENPK